MIPQASLCIPEARWIRSGRERARLASRIALVNSPGLVDSGYRGEMAIIMINTDKREAFHIKRGDRIAQLVIQKVESGGST